MKIPAHGIILENNGSGRSRMTVIREAAVAGRFYPGTARELSATIRAYLDAAPCDKRSALTPLSEARPKALIVPHAGYIYSGPVAASAYARLRPYAQCYTRVILLGPCHTIPVHGLALSGADAFCTPLGAVPLDKEAITQLQMPEVRVFDATHKFEHSLEVHLPFLQSVIGSFLLIPIVVGDVSPETVANVIDRLWGGPETLIVISSDLSHYLQYEEACAIDRMTCTAIENLQHQSINHANACGATPIRGLLIALQRRRITGTTLDLRNSGDTAGDQCRVVGYGSWMFPDTDTL